MDFETILTQFQSYYSSLGLSAEGFLSKCFQENNASVLSSAMDEAVTLEEQDVVDLIARLSSYFVE